MPGVATHIRSGDSAALASPALLPMVIGCASAATTNQIYTFDPGADVSASIGGGIGADAVYYLLRATGGRVRYVQAAPTWGSTPSVTHSGSGPAVTFALASGASGPFDDFNVVMTVTQGGNGGEGASMSVSYDGSTVIETVPIPAEVPAVLDGSIDITTGAPVSALTLEFTDPVPGVITFSTGSLVASTAGLKAATATSASPVTLHASDLLTAGKTAIAANPRRLKFTTAGGTPADAPANVVITGTLWGVAVTETLVLAQTAAAVTSAKSYDAIVSLAYAAGDGTAATIAIGYSDGYANGQEVCDAFNALATTAALGVLARPAQQTSGSTLFELYTTTAGAAVTIAIDTASCTGDVVLGFVINVNDDALGAAATFSPPWTGGKWTFPASSAYVLGETYTTGCQGPRASLSAIMAAATAAKSAYKTTPFGFFVIAQPSDTAANCAALEVAMASATASWAASTNAAIFVAFAVGAPFFVASTNPTTNATNIQAADAALLLAFQAAAANFGNVATCDEYLPGSTSLRFGSYRRTAGLAWGAQHAAAAKLAADVGDGYVSEASLLAPDLVTLARDDETATTKLGGGQGPGFSALYSTMAGLAFVKFEPGATRAGPTSRLRFIGPLTVAYEIARLVYPVAQSWKAQTVPVDPLTNQMQAAEKQQRQGRVYALLQPTLLPQDGPPNVSPLENDLACRVQIKDPVSGRFLDNGQVVVEIVFKPLGEIEDVTVYITATGSIASVTAGG